MRLLPGGAMRWLIDVLPWLVSHWKICTSVIAGIGTLVIWIYKWREAKAKAQIAAIQLETLKTRAEKEKAEAHIRQLAERIRVYAEHAKDQRQNRRLVFLERSLADVLAEDRDKLSEVLEYLRKEGHAQKSWSGYWRIS
jgi:hypothetical protein